MTADQSADAIWYVLALVLVGSAFFGRGVGARRGFGLVLIWIAIFGGIAWLYSARKEIGRRIAGDPPPIYDTARTKPTSDGDKVSIAQSPDGHYWVSGTINGHAVRFLVDSGATVTALSGQTARDAGLNIESGPGVTMRTANGTTTAYRARVGSLAVGPVSLGDFPVVVSDSFGDMNVLGMNFLSRLRSWRVESGVMVLEP